MEVKLLTRNIHTFIKNPIRNQSLNPIRHCVIVSMQLLLLSESAATRITQTQETLPEGACASLDFTQQAS